ncbi:MAG: TVP38/TMEM64 family protein [Promethearchaeota archaeon]
MKEKSLNSEKKDQSEKSKSSKIKKFISDLWQRFLRTWSGHDKKTWLWIIAFLAIILISIAVFIKMKQDNTWLFNLVVNYFVKPMLSLKFWGLVIFIVFMGVQGIIAPIPSELMLLCTGMIWGIWVGTFIGIIGSMAAGIMAYEIAFRGGRPLAEKFIGDDLFIIDRYVDKYGTWAIFIGRAFPFMAFDPLSYASGFIGIKRKKYWIATLFGSIIRCTIYAFLGNSMTQGNINEIIDNPSLLNEFIQTGSTQFNMMFLIIIILLVVAFLGYQFILIPYLRKKQISNEIEGVPLPQFLIQDIDGFSKPILKNESKTIDFNQTMKIAQEKEEREDFQNASYLYGEILIALKNSQDNSQDHAKNKEILKDLVLEEAKVVENLGILYYKMGKSENGLQSLQHALGIYDKFNKFKEEERVRNLIRENQQG